jgi:hypothetical protein
MLEGILGKTVVCTQDYELEVRKGEIINLKGMKFEVKFSCDGDFYLSNNELETSVQESEIGDLFVIIQ